MEKYLRAFVRRVELEGLPVEAISAYVGDKPLFSHHWKADKPRNIYSHTKSFMATAVGMAVSDGVLALSDKPAEFFPEAAEGADPRVLEITLRDLLMMASGLGGAYLMAVERKNGEGAPDYAKYILSHAVKDAPGSRFLYSNGDSYLASRMVERATGQTLIDYLAERLFHKLSIPRPEWERCPMGHTFGASGMLLTIDDMMKLGRLYLKGGRWDGERIIDPQWIQKATAKQIETHDAPGNIWHIGYGYQFWRSPYPESYRADGAFGQITMVLPQADAVVAVQCTEIEGAFSGIQRALHEEIFSRL